MASRQSRRIALAAAAFMATATFAADAGVRFEDSGTGRQIILGVGSGLTSILYTPVKFVYAAGATVTGGIVLAITNGEEAQAAVRVVRRGTGGDWFVHPDVFTGNRRLRFHGGD